MLFLWDASAQENYFDKRNHVGDILFNPATDHPDFELLDEENIMPFNNICGFYIEGERYRVLNYFKENYKAERIEGVTGYITIRFIVNHKGQTDRFRVCEMDNDYQDFHFPPVTKNTLLTLTKNLNGWLTTLDTEFKRYKSVTTECNGQITHAYDYHQHILFKMKDGQIETILP
jgi:hypothetical protein